MRIVYMGTPDFAVPALQALYDGGHEILAVTKADRPRGRGNKMTPCEVKQRALELGIPVLSPEKLRGNTELVQALADFKPDIMVVAAYGKLLPQSILDIAPLGCINIHGSLLPEYRGAAPIQRAVLDGREITGVTLMYVGPELDCGDIIASACVSTAKKSSEQLFAELADLGAELLMEQLPLLKQGKASRIPQDPERASYAAMVTKEEGLIDFSRSAEDLEHHVLGMYSWPIAYTFYNGQMMKVHEAEVSELRAEPGTAPGTVIRADKNGIAAVCGDGSVLLLKKIQMPGKKAMDAAAWLVGNRIETGSVLG